MRGLSEPRLLVEVGGKMIEEPQRIQTSSNHKNGHATIRSATQRPFDARVFLTLAISQEPDREDLRREFERMIRSHAAIAP
jgi:hypothetical protein